MRPSLSIVMPAFNEEANLRGAVEILRQILGDRFSSYEIIIIDDGSTDSTAKIADQLAAENSWIKVVHHPQNRGLGHSLREGYLLAAKEYVFWFGGSNTFKAETLPALFDRIGQADIIIPYFSNSDVRSIFRRYLSHAFTASLNFLFGVKIRYYNAATIYRTERIKPVVARAFSNGHFFMAEILLRCLEEGQTFIEVPAEHQPQPSASSKALYPKNVLNVLVSIGKLWLDLRTKKGMCFSKLHEAVRQ